jgi:HEAT repeat protein
MPGDFEADVRRAVHAVDRGHRGETNSKVDELLATGVRSYADLISAVSSESLGIRLTACWLLGRAMVQDTTQPARARGAAAESLSNAGTGDPSIVPVLVLALEDPSPEVRFNAAYGLGQLRSVVGSDALQALARVAATEDGEAPGGRVRDQAQASLDILLTPLEPS